jgi:lipopolysaccharide heptosyltransferase II
MNRDKWQAARNILCIRLDYLGDVLMCTPAIRALKQSEGGRTITLLSSPPGSAVARYIPEVDAVMEYAAPWMKSSATHSPTVDIQLVEILRARRFDAAVIFTTYSQNPLPSALLCYLAGIPLRLAYCHENPYQLLSDWIHDPEPQETIRHEVRRQLDLVAETGSRTGNECLSFCIPEDDKVWVIRQLHAMDIDRGKPWLLLHPGATAASRRYPPELWAEVADALVKDLRCPLVFTGGKDEVPLVESIRCSMRAESHSLAGILELGKLAAMIARATVMVSGNTGPAHIAAALGTPIVNLYALTNPQHTPWKVPCRVLYHDVACRNCYKSICPLEHNACLAKIEPPHVAAAVADLMVAVVAGTTEAEYSKPMLPHALHAVTANPLPLSSRRSSVVGPWT